MRAQDIKIGEFYRHREIPNYAWAKALELTEVSGKTMVRCEWKVHKDDTFGTIQYFRPADLLKGDKHA
jgi:hypothetical protein